MEMIEIAGYLPTGATTVKHSTAKQMEIVVRGMAEENGGKVVSFEITKPGTALLMVMGEAAQQLIVKEFKRLQDAVVTQISALDVHRERNKRSQERADRMRAQAAKRKEK
jgi:hypothetical protein